MRKGISRAFGMAALTSLAVNFSTNALAQSGQFTDVTIEGHIYEPQRLAPTNERVGKLQVAAGFSVQRFAEGLDNPRILATADNGDVYVTQRKPGNVVLLRDLDSDGIADVQKIVLRLKNAHGIAIRGRQVYIATVKHVYVGDLRNDGSIGRLRTLIRDLPDGGQHPNRTLGFSPQGELFVTVGSTCNECRETNPEHATLLRVTDAEGDHDRRHGPESKKNREIYSSGLRNTLGFDWHPASGRLFGLDNGIDWLGDNEQSEELNELLPRHRYGWPYVYDEDQFNPHTEPQFLTQAQWARLSDEPVGMYTPHAAAMQMRFYRGTQFPAQYASDAFAAFRGSWNRKPPSGYEVVRLRFTGGGEFQAFEPFVTGFIESQPDGTHGFFGRPVGLTLTQDGAVLFSDDTNNTLYKVSYGASAALPPQQLARQILPASAPLTVASSAIGPGQPIDKKYTDYGKGISPPLSWSGVPARTRSLVLMMEDPDALAPLPFVHWLAINIPPQLKSLPPGIDTDFQPLRGQPLRQGSNSISARGYFGPRPPPGDPPHHYHFQLFALDTTLDLPDGFNRHALLEAMRGHVLASGELIGTFQQPE
jgi:Raf kinase inhibitor-like YbhB/YbcL family protein